MNYKITMARYGKTCELCFTDGLNLKECRGDELKDSDHLDSFNFLAGIHTKENPTKIVKRYVCQTCSAKVKLISSIRSESVKGKADATEIEASDKGKKQNKEAVDDDLDLEELDQLSLFYAEQDDPEKDPDFAPKSIKKSNKKTIRKPKVINAKVKTTNKNHEALRQISERYSCPNCQNDNQHFKSIESLQLHFFDVHGLKQESENKEDTRTVRLRCQNCFTECLSHDEYISHVRSCYAGATKPASTCKMLISAKSFRCDTCPRTFRRKATLKSHKQNCYYLNSENGPNQTECKICRKEIIPSRMAAHYSFEHVCRICDDQFIFSNRKEKCQHLELVHKWWTKHKVKKALGEVPCPKEGCLQKFPRGSRRLKSHIKRDHEDSNASKRLFECDECHALLKNITCLRSHKQTIHRSKQDRIKCPYCEFNVGKWRKHSLYR